MNRRPAPGTTGRTHVHRSTIVRRRWLPTALAATLVASCAAGGPGPEPADDGVEPVVTESATPVGSATESASESVPDIPWADLTVDVEREDPAVFDYDPVRPVEYEVVGTADFEGFDFELITFESPVGGTATAHLIHPVGEPAPGAAVLWGHGVPADGSDAYFAMAIFACAGATSLVVDAPFARPGGAGLAEPLSFTDQDRLDQIQLVVDMRRGLDLLADLGGRQFGFGGGSYGAAIGAQLIGVDDRVGAAILVLGSAGVVQRFTTDTGRPGGPLAGVPDEQARDWIVTMAPVEPVHYIGDSAAEVLFMNGEHDPVIPPADARVLHEAGPAGSEVYWMDAGHDLPFTDLARHNEFLGDRLGVDADRLAACTDQLFPEGW